jgi:polyferredoxin
LNVFVLMTRFRVFCHWLCNHNYFGNIILACILISSAMLAAEDPLSTETDRNKVSKMNNRPIRLVLFDDFTLIFHVDFKSLRLLLHHRVHH